MLKCCRIFQDVLMGDERNFVVTFLAMYNYNIPILYTRYVILFWNLCNIHIEYVLMVMMDENRHTDTKKNSKRDGPNFTIIWRKNFTHTYLLLPIGLVYFNCILGTYCKQFLSLLHIKFWSEKNMKFKTFASNVNHLGFFCIIISV